MAKNEMTKDVVITKEDIQAYMQCADPTMDMKWKTDSPVPRITVKGTRCRIAGARQVTIRIARIVERKGKAKKLAEEIKRTLVKALLRGEGVLFAGRPSTGKTTLMREIARTLSLALPYLAHITPVSSVKVLALDRQREILGEDPDFNASGLVTSACQAGDLKVNMGQVAVDAVQVQNPNVVVLDEIADPETSDIVRGISTTVTTMGSTHLSIDSQSVCEAASVSATSELDGVNFAVADVLLSDVNKTALLGGIKHTTLGDTVAKEEEVTKDRLSSETASRPFQYLLYMNSTRPEDWHILCVRDMLDAYFGVRNTTNPKKTFGPEQTLHNDIVGLNRQGCVLHGKRPMNIKAVVKTCPTGRKLMDKMLGYYEEYIYTRSKNFEVEDLYRGIGDMPRESQLWLFSSACSKCRALLPDKTLLDYFKGTNMSDGEKEHWCQCLRKDGEDFEEACRMIPKPKEYHFAEVFKFSRDIVQFALVCAMCDRDFFKEARNECEEMGSENFYKKYPFFTKINKKGAKKTLKNSIFGTTSAQPSVNKKRSGHPAQPPPPQKKKKTE